MQRSRKIWFGALIGLILSIPLAAIAYAGYRRGDFPFTPFNIFDWQTRHLPGEVLAAGIGAMVRTIGWLGFGNTSATAKLAEQSIAVVEFLLAGTVVGAVFFAVVRSIERTRPVIAGLVTGAVIGAGALWIGRNVEITGSDHPVESALWILALYAACGAALGWAYGQTISETRAGTVAGDGGERTNRRTFLIRLGAVAGIVSAAGVALGKAVGKNQPEASPVSGKPWSSRNPLPNASAAVRPVAGSRPEFTPLAQHYRIDINTIPPEIQETSWRLRVSGLLAKPLVFTLDDIRGRTPMHQFITLSCISNEVGGDLIGTTRWTGVSVKQMLPELGLLANATHLKIRSADGFYEVVALDTIRADDRVMLAYAWDGLPLAAKHGFPLRIYIPDRYGMKQPKWIESIEAIDHWEAGYWVVRGWDREARMKATSAIDAIDSSMMIGERNVQMKVPIGGFAHAGVRGISRVEIQVDEGRWQSAELRAPLSGQTWVIWRYDWPIERGKHKFTVRCFDGNGNPQIEHEAPPDPNGATGYYSRTAMF